MNRRRGATAAGAAMLAFCGLFVGTAGAQGGEEGPMMAPATEPEEPSAPRDPETRPQDPPLIQSGSMTPTPVIDGDIENVPNLTDLELAAARLTISAQKAQTNLSVAPFLIPGRYTMIASETRIGVSADSDGAFGLGLAIGYNGPRVRLDGYSKDPAFCEPEGALMNDAPLQALEEEIKATLLDLCNLTATACDGATDSPCKEAIQQCASATAGPSATNGGAPRVPLVLRLVQAIRRLETLKETGSPPTPPRAPEGGAKDNNEYLMALSAYIGQATAFQARRAALASIRLLLPTARELRARYEQVGEGAALERHELLVGERQLCRLEAAYRRSSLLTLGGSVSFFPLYLGPAITKTGADGMPYRTNDHFLRRVDATLAYRFYANRRASAQLRGGFRAERGDPSEASQLLWRGLLGADLGFFKPIDDIPDPDGFQRGIGFGVSATAWFCGASGGCVTDVGTSSPYGGSGLLPLSRRVQLTGFIEWRQAVALQIRAGIETRIDSVVGPLNTDGTAPSASPILTRVIPTLGLGSSFWGL